MINYLYLKKKNVDHGFNCNINQIFEFLDFQGLASSVREWWCETSRMSRTRVIRAMVGIVSWTRWPVSRQCLFSLIYAASLLEELMTICDVVTILGIIHLPSPFLIQLYSKLCNKAIFLYLMADNIHRKYCKIYIHSKTILYL